MTAPDSAADGGPSESDGPPLTIQQVSSVLNVPAATIRSWERRYGVPTADRSSGGHRRYNPKQLHSLRRMRDLIAQGWRPVEAAQLVQAGAASSPGSLIAAFLEGARDLAPETIARTLDRADQALGLDRTVDEVLMPAMREIGEEWHVGRIDVAHEHLATNAARAWLANLVPPGPLRPQPPIILSCGPDDQHTLGLEALGALLRQRLCDSRLLGAQTPVESLGRAVEKTNAAAVVLACHVTGGRQAAIQALRSTRLRPSQLFYAGGGFSSRRARQGVPGHFLGSSIAQAADLVADAVIATPSGFPR